MTHNTYPPLRLHSALYDFEVHTPRFDTLILTRIKWSTMYGNYAIYKVNGTEHTSGFANLGYNITGNEKSDTVSIDSYLDCRTF